MALTFRAKLFNGLVVFLVIANIATITAFWINRARVSRPGPPPPAKFLIDELKLTGQQQARFDVLRLEHRKAVDSIMSELKVAKASFFSLLKTPAATDSVRAVAVREIGRRLEAIDLVTLKHFEKVRAICDYGQQQKFDAIIGDILDMINAPRSSRDFDSSLMPPPHDSSDNTIPAPPGGFEDGPPPSSPSPRH